MEPAFSQSPCIWLELTQPSCSKGGTVTEPCLKKGSCLLATALRRVRGPRVGGIYSAGETGRGHLPSPRMAQEHANPDLHTTVWMDTTRVGPRRRSSHREAEMKHGENGRI